MKFQNKTLLQQNEFILHHVHTVFNQKWSNFKIEYLKKNKNTKHSAHIYTLFEVKDVEKNKNS